MALVSNRKEGKVIRSVATITFMGNGFLIGGIIEHLAKDGFQVQGTPIYNENNMQVGEKLEVFEVSTYEEPKEERRKGIYD